MIKHYLLNLMIFSSVLFHSCDFNDHIIEYEQNLVVFASIEANLPVKDTVLVSRSASIDEDVFANDLWVNDAMVVLIDDSTGITLPFINVGPGKYFPVTDTSGIQDLNAYINYIIRPGATYSLVVKNEIDSVIAKTTVPAAMNIRPIDLGDYECPDGEVLPAGVIDVNNLDSLSFEQLLTFASDPINYIISNNINVDTVIYRFGDCFTKSFASYPMFGVDFDADDYQTVKILSYALDANKRGLEPLDSLSNTLDPDSGGFIDYNYNRIRDSVFVNLIYDTTLGFTIWKGRYLRDENSVPYRINPWQWNIETAPTPVMWLYFDYYGLQLMTFQATSESYFNYFSGDPVGLNIWLLPDSNFEGGLGVFYSSFASRFLVHVKRDE